MFLHRISADRCGEAKVKFMNGMRLVIAEPVSRNEILRGRTATVIRLLRRSREQAWVKVDGDPLPDSVRCFPASDERANHILVWDDECAEVPDERQ